MAGFSSLGRVLRLLRDEADRRVRWSMAGAVCLVAASGVLSAATPLALKHLVDAVTASTGSAPAAALAQAAQPGLIYLLALAASRIALDLRPVLSGLVDQRLQARLSRRFFAHLMRLPLAFLLRRRGGELLHGLDLATTGSQLVLAHLTNSIVPVLVEIATMATILIQLGQPALVTLFGVTAAAYLAVFATGTRLLAKPVHAVSACSLEVHAQLTDGITHAETLRCFTAERQVQDALQASTGTLEARWLKLNRLSLAIALAASLTFSLSMAGCLLISVDAVSRGTLSVGGFVLATVYMLQMVRPLETLGSASRDIARALGFMAPLLDMLNEPCEPAQAAGTAPARPESGLPRTAPSIQIHNLHFGYDGTSPILRDLSLEIRAGKTTAIVGRSGCGKSTLARLLMRLYEPQAGRILLDGQPIETLPIDQLRGLIGLVPQDTALLHTTLANNIALGVPSATKDDIDAAARTAGLCALAGSLPHGYDTAVGERGLQLSGGERQRVAIARAILRRPALFILDEPTSMLDSKTEATILLALRRLTTGCTTLVIAHRLATVMHADEIVVLEGGRVQERGRHAELLAKGGLYAKLWRQQTQGTE